MSSDRYRVMVTGSRDWTERTVIRMALASWGFSHTTLVHGAASGADKLAAEIAAAGGATVEAHPAQWKKHGKAAGPLRNVEMLDSGIDQVLAFWKGGSKGTAHAIREAKKRGIPVKAYIVDDDYTKMRIETWAPDVPAYLCQRGHHTQMEVTNIAEAAAVGLRYRRGSDESL